MFRSQGKTPGQRRSGRSATAAAAMPAREARRPSRRSVVCRGPERRLVCLDLKTGRGFGGRFGRRRSAVAAELGLQRKRAARRTVGSSARPAATKRRSSPLDKPTGKTVWGSPPGGGAAYASIVKAEFGGVKQYVQFLDAGVFGFAAKTVPCCGGTTPPSNDTANIPTPIAFGNAVFAASGYGTGGGAAEIKRGTAFVGERKILFERHDLPTRRHDRRSTATSTAAPTRAFSPASTSKPARRNGANARRASARWSTSTADSSRGANGAK